LGHCHFAAAAACCSWLFFSTKESLDRVDHVIRFETDEKEAGSAAFGVSVLENSLRETDDHRWW
jgi:hypothetical protein